MRIKFAIAFLITATTAQADVPRVMTDIAPVHSITAAVMGDLGTPELLLPANADAHYFQLRPSQARALANTDLIVWMGPEMTPWLKRIMSQSKNKHLSLLDQHDAPLRIIGEEQEDEDHSEEKDAGTGDHDEKGNDQDHDHDHAHDHDGLDPHAWLDALNGAFYAKTIANTLAKLDPENATTYQDNAETLAAELQALVPDLTQQMKHQRDTLLLPYHGAYRYFFTRHDLPIKGSLADVEGKAPSAHHLSDLREAIAQHTNTCLFLEPGANEKLAYTAWPNAPEGTVHKVLDPLGVNQPIGPRLYPDLLRQLAADIATCRQQ